MTISEIKKPMTQIEKYNNIFIELFGVKKDELEALVYQSVASWDSVGHMGLMAALEEGFDVMLETEDIISFASYNNGKEILRKYGIEI